MIWPLASRRGTRLPRTLPENPVRQPEKEYVYFSMHVLNVALMQLVNLFNSVFLAEDHN